MFSAPTMFVLTASKGLYSQTGTCFIAAAWKTTSVPRSSDTTELGSRMSPIWKCSREWRSSS